MRHNSVVIDTTHDLILPLFPTWQLKSIALQVKQLPDPKLSSMMKL